MVMCEFYKNMGCIIDLIQIGKLQVDFGLLLLNFEDDCIMLCGSLVLLKDMQEMLEICGFKEGSMMMLGDYVIECVFVDKQMFEMVVCVV